uniref:Uncharacterized protein n=1 Tax=Arundo donax TaxID=35708 RepID=A0A0A9CRY8_ARUDO
MDGKTFLSLATSNRDTSLCLKAQVTKRLTAARLWPIVACLFLICQFHDNLRNANL